MSNSSLAIESRLTMDDKIQHAQLDLCFMKLTATPNWLGRKSRFALSLIVAFCVAIGSGTNRINAQPPQESTLHPPTAKSPPVVPGTTKLNSDQTHSILNPPSITQRMAQHAFKNQKQSSIPTFKIHLPIRYKNRSRLPGKPWQN